LKKILLINGTAWLNKGDAAIAITTIGALRTFIPDVNICMLSPSSRMDGLKYKKYNIITKDNLVNRFLQRNRKTKIGRIFDFLDQLCRWSLWAVFYRFLNTDIEYLKGDEADTLNEYTDADIIVSRGGDILNDIGYSPMFQLYEIFLGELLNKPVVIYAHSIGPFERKFTKFINRFVLNRVSLITLREEVSYDCLRRLGVNKPPILVTADSAFLLQPISSKNARNLMFEDGVYLCNRNLIGLTVRRWFFLEENIEKFNEYKKIMAKVIDYLVDKLNSTVIFFPQVIVPHEEENDTTVAKEIFRLVKNKDNFKILTKDYSPEELMGMIGQMDLFIGTRMHSNIFAVSMSVPTIAIGYRHKTRGIMEMLGLEKYVCEINSIEYDDIISKIDDAWMNKEIIKDHLNFKINDLRKRSLYNAELVKKCLDRR
jgi:colanic acid/amylovoran biosynthesis protein